MNIPLDILALLVTGAYALFACFLIVFMATSNSPVKQFAAVHHHLFYRSVKVENDRRRSSESRVLGPSKFFIGSIIVAVVFTFGIAVDHLSDKFQDNTKQLLFFSYNAADTNNNIKASAFLRVYSDRVDQNELVAKLDNCLKKPDPKAEPPTQEMLDACKEAISEAKTIYYKSKNAVFRHPNYYSDLTNIRTRLDFKRSMTFVTAIVIYALLFGISLCVVRRVAEFSAEKNILQIPLVDNVLSHYKELHFKKLFMLLVVTSSLWYLMVLGWSHQEKQYALRAYGYYTSMTDANNQNMKSDQMKEVTAQWIISDYKK